MSDPNEKLTPQEVVSHLNSNVVPLFRLIKYWNELVDPNIDQAVRTAFITGTPEHRIQAIAALDPAVKAELDRSRGGGSAAPVAPQAARAPEPPVMAQIPEIPVPQPPVAPVAPAAPPAPAAAEIPDAPAKRGRKAAAAPTPAEGEAKSVDLSDLRAAVTDLKGSATDTQIALNRLAAETYAHNPELKAQIAELRGQIADVRQAVREQREQQQELLGCIAFLAMMMTGTPKEVLVAEGRRMMGLPPALPQRVGRQGHEPRR